MRDGTSPSDPPEDGRAVPDRRRRRTPMISRYLLLGRRRQARRDDEGLFVYVDRPGGWILGAFVGIVGLSLLDAWYTLDLLQSGATEANPLMRAALHLGDRPFVIIKTVVTILATSFLCLHKNWPLGRVCLAAALVGYSVLVLYHLHWQALIRAFGA
jgi:hypothetical protein